MKEALTNSNQNVPTRIGTPFPDDISDSITYNLEDQIGSSTVRLNTSGAVIDKEEYYPFGDSSLRTFSKKRYRYVGKEKDIESGLYYYGARYYAAWTCRFISIDPMAADYAHLTPYNNAGNKPINSVDIDGMQGESESKSESGGGQEGGGGDEIKDGGTLDEVKVTASKPEGKEYSYNIEIPKVTIDNAIDKPTQNNLQIEKTKIAVEDYKNEPFTGPYGGEYESEFEYDQMQRIAENYQNNPEAIGNTATFNRGAAQGEAIAKSIPFFQAGLDYFSGNEVSKVDLAIDVASFIPLSKIVPKGVLKKSLKLFKSSKKAASSSTTIGTRTVGAARAGFSKLPKGFKQTKQFGYQHGQKVYKYKGKFYSRDIDAHNGGAWKVFENVGGRLKRIGTADESLNIFKR